MGRFAGPGSSMQNFHMNPAGFYRRLPLTPERMTERVTATDDAIVLCHVGVPHIATADWSLTIDGLVDAPARLSFEALRQFPNAQIVSVHQCAGSPLQPAEPSRRVCNVRWGGVRLADIIAACKPKKNARFLWSFGADRGEFGGVAIENYLKDLPIERVVSDVLIAHEMNGAPLKPEHGYPARLVVPGFYGTNSVKWLTRLTLSDRRAESPFTTVWYNDPVIDERRLPTGRTSPVWSIAPQSVIASPAPGATVPCDVRVSGWAWCDGGVEAVEVSTDAGATWSRAELEPVRGWEWRRFEFSCAGRLQPGTTAILAARAIGRNGACQPDAGSRNAVHRVEVAVQGAV